MKKKKSRKKAAVKRVRKPAKARPKRPVRSKTKLATKTAKPKAAKKAPRSAPAAPAEIPKDLRIALEGEGVLATFEALTPGKQRAYINRVESAKLMKGRLRGIEATVEAMQRLYYDGFRR